jgi:hypothetical protein
LVRELDGGHVDTVLFSGLPSAAIVNAAAPALMVTTLLTLDPACGMPRDSTARGSGRARDEPRLVGFGKHDGELLAAVAARQILGLPYPLADGRCDPFQNLVPSAWP